MTLHAGSACINNPAERADLELRHACHTCAVPSGVLAPGPPIGRRIGDSAFVARGSGDAALAAGRRKHATVVERRSSRAGTGNQQRISAHALAATGGSEGHAWATTIISRFRPVRQSAGGRTLSVHPVCRRRAGFACAITQRHQSPGRAGADRPQIPALRLSRTWWSPIHCWISWARRSFRRTRFSFTGPPGTARPASRSACCAFIRTRCYLPYAVEVDGQVISLYDPVVHQQLDRTITHSGSALGAVPAALHRGGRRADSQHAGIAPG